MFDSYLDDSDLTLDFELDVGVFIGHDGGSFGCYVFELTLLDFPIWSSESNGSFQSLGYTSLKRLVER